LFTIANEIGTAVLQKVFSKFENRVELHISSGKHGITTSLEFEEQDSTANIMISDVGDIENYGMERISAPDDLESLKSAKCVILTNWASNLKGTELALHVFKHSGNALHFLDPADIDARRNEFREALKIIAETTDVLSFNENECNSLTSALGLGASLSKDPTNVDLIKSTVKMISEEFGIEIDLHTRAGSAWSNGKETLFEPAFSIQVHNLTGSGDCWDAADVIGYLAHLPPNERLILSNACSALYIQSRSFEPPNLEEIMQFLNKNSRSTR
jgi:ribokinase